MTVVERVDKKTHVPKDRLVKCPPFPDSIKIESTSRCNYKCPCCSTWKDLRKQGDMDHRLMMSLLSEAHGIGVKQVGLFLLGEPLLVESLPNYVNYAKALGFENVFLTTNGSLCDPRMFGDLLYAGLDSLKFSVNAGSRESYKKAHGVDKFDVVMKNIRDAVELREDMGRTKPHISVSTIYDPIYEEELNDFEGRMKCVVDEFYYLPRYSQAGHVYGMGGNVGRMDNPVNPIPCWALFNSARVTWDGWLTACCFDHSEEFKIQDVSRHSLLSAWKDEKFQSLRQAHLDEDPSGTLCRKCLGL